MSTSTAPVEQPQPLKEVDDNDDAASLFEYKNVPEESAWLLSRLTFAWQRPLFRRANQLHSRDRALQQDDLLPLPSWDYSAKLGPLFDESWKARSYVPVESTKDKPSTKRLSLALLDVMGRRIYVAGLIKFVNSALQFCFPLLLNAILKFIQQTQQGLIGETEPWYVQYRGYWLSGLLLLAMASKAITENAYFQHVIRCGYHVKTAVSVAVYQKSLRLTNAERQSTTLGT